MFTSEKYEEIKEKLYSAVLADILDEVGCTDFAAEPGILPVSSEMKIFGKAFTMLATAVYEEPAEPYKMQIEAIDSLKTGEVVVATTNGRNSFWGELMSTAASQNGSRGAVIDGLTRDQYRIKKIGFPVFARGSSPLDSKGRTEVIAYQVPIVCGGVKVFPGDLVFADIDGIVFIPGEKAKLVIEKALEKVSGENKVRDEILNGKSMREVFDKYRIL